MQTGGDSEEGEAGHMTHSSAGLLKLRNVWVATNFEHEERPSKVIKTGIF